jgi:ferritin-like protein
MLKELHKENLEQVVHLAQAEKMVHLELLVQRVQLV